MNRAGPVNYKEIYSNPGLYPLLILVSSFLSLTLFPLISNAFSLSPPGGKVWLYYQEHSGCDHRYRINVESTVSFRSLAGEKKQRKIELSEIVMNVRHDPANYRVIMDIRCDSGEVILDGERLRNENVGRYVTIILHPHGRILSTTDREAMYQFQDAIIPFPEKKLGTGDKWKVAFPYKDEEGHSRVAMVNQEIVDFKEFQGRKCAVIKSSLELMKKKTEEFDTLLAYNGKTWFDYEKGMLVAAQNKISIKFIYFRKNEETGKREKDNSTFTVVSTNISLIK